MIRKALIPIAGKATRLMPLTSVVPKAVLPLVDASGRIRPVLHLICQEAVMAGAEQIGIIVSPWQTDLVRRYFSVIDEEGSTRFSSRINYIAQHSPAGFGDAVLGAHDFVGEDAFLLLLGDHIHLADANQPPCAFQVVNAFDSVDAVAMTGMQTVSADQLCKVGVAGGVHVGNDIYRCTHFAEKPDLHTARQTLATKGLPEDCFLGHCGIYVFSPEIFAPLTKVQAAAQKTGKETELADAQSLLLKEYPEKYFLHKIAGRAHDVGSPEGYAEAFAAFRKKGEIN